MSQNSQLAQVISLLPEGLDWSGRSGRLVFLVSVVLLIAAMYALKITQPFSIGNSVAIVAQAVGFLVFLGHARRRLRDVGLSGWAMWVLLVPLVNTLFVIFLAAKKGEGSEDTGTGYSRLAFVAVCCLAGLLLTRLIWAPFWIPAGSMKPTLLVGDYLTVTRSADPQRGDVLVFRHPLNGSDYIKRLIGLPGDTVQMIAGDLHLNGAAVDKQADGDFEEVMGLQGPLRTLPRCGNGQVGHGQACLKKRAIETLPEGGRYAVLNIFDGPLDNTLPYTVSEGQYFFMGDNRDNSADSRMQQTSYGIGFVPRENIVGRANRVLFSSAGTSIWQFWTWRSDRFFVSIP